MAFTKPTILLIAQPKHIFTVCPAVIATNIIIKDKMKLL
jgi:hypothetical protein